MARRHRSRIVSAAIALTVLLAGGSPASQLVPLSDDRLVEQSSLVVIGRCTGVRSAWMGRRLMTLATVAVREVLKGEPRAEVTVVIPGGMDAQRAVPVAAVVEGAPQLATGEEALLFLSARPDEPDTYAIVGWGQGKRSILTDATGAELVAAGSGRPPATVPLARFRAQILQRVESGAVHP